MNRERNNKQLFFSFLLLYDTACIRIYSVCHKENEIFCSLWPRQKNQADNKYRALRCEYDNDNNPITRIRDKHYTDFFIVQYNLQIVT